MLFRKKDSAVDPAAPRRRRFFKPALVTLAVVLVAGSLVGFRATQAKKEDKKADAPIVLEFTPSDVAIVELRGLVRSIPFSGSLAPLVQTTVKAKVAGEINKLFVREGENVTRGQVLAQIETVDLQSRLDAQEGALEEARAKLSIAEKNRENGLALLRQKFISQNAFDTTHSTYEASAASVRAPFNGIVARKLVNAGEKVGIDSPLFGLVDLANMEIEAPAPAAEIPAVKPGQAASFRVDGFGERVFTGKVERINPSADAGSRSITLYISVANQDGALKGGMFAKGDIVLESTAISTVIPVSAVRDEAGQAYVFTIEGGKIGKRAGKRGATEPQRGLGEVRSGLEEGISVVSARVSGLKPGAPAVIKAAPAKAA